MSFWSSVVSIKCRSIKCRFDQVLFDQLSGHDQIFFIKMQSSWPSQSQLLPSPIDVYLFFIFIFTFIFQPHRKPLEALYLGQAIAPTCFQTSQDIAVRLQLLYFDFLAF